MCPILRGKMGLDTPPALAGAGVRNGLGGRSPPTDVVRVVWGGGLVAAFIGDSAPLPPGLLRGSAASEAKQRTAVVVQSHSMTG